MPPLNKDTISKSGKTLTAASLAAVGVTSYAIGAIPAAVSYLSCVIGAHAMYIAKSIMETIADSDKASLLIKYPAIFGLAVIGTLLSGIGELLFCVTAIFDFVAKGLIDMALNFNSHMDVHMDALGVYYDLESSLRGCCSNTYYGFINRLEDKLEGMDVEHPEMKAYLKEIKQDLFSNEKDPYKLSLGETIKRVLNESRNTGPMLFQKSYVTGADNSTHEGDYSQDWRFITPW